MSLLKEKLELRVEEAEFKAQQALSNFAPWQKWALTVCLIGIIPAYFIAQSLSNYYYKKEYKQYLIEARPSFTDSKALLIDRIDIASLGEKEFAAVAQIVNQNLDLAAKNVSYKMDFLASDGQLAAPSVQGQFYILPSQRKYLVAPKIVAQNVVASANLILDEKIVWQKKLEIPEVKLITNQPKGQDQLSPFGYALEGAIMNNSAYFLKEAKLIFLLYGVGGKIIGASQRSEFDLKPFERRDYKQIWSGISGANVVRAEVIAETDLLNRENLQIPDLPTDNGAGSLER